jgi:hypothetical protein
MTNLDFESESESSDIDFSWIDKETKMGSCDTNYIREPIHSIKLFFIYINSNLEIEYVSNDVETLVNIPSNIQSNIHSTNIPSNIPSNIQSIIPSTNINKERLLHIIQNKRHHNNKKYRLDDILSFQIHLEPENIQSFVSSTTPDTFLKSVPIFDNISCIPSIFIFHDIASLYFLFYEIDTSRKSILKNSHSSNNHRITKKVHIHNDVISDTTLHNNKSTNNKSVKKFIKKLKLTRKSLL